MTMFNYPWITLAYSVALLGTGYLLSRMLHHGLNTLGTPIRVKQEAPKKTRASQRERSETRTDGAVVAADAPSIRDAAPPNIEFPEVPIAGSELRYYKPFGPTDSIFDVWAKLQTFTSTEPILVRLIPTDDTTPILQSAFLADGTLQSTREMFCAELGNSIRTAGPSAWRAVRRLSSFGIPCDTSEGSYHFSTGTLRMELKGVQVMGLTFTVRVTFEPNLGLIPKYLSRATDYFHCEIPSGDAPARGRGKPEMVVVGFPWSLTSVTLYSDDRCLDEEASKITKAIIDKYWRYVKQEQVAMPTSEDATRKVSVISDEIVAIAIHEGLFKTKRAQGRFLQIEYGPFPQGPLDALSAGDAEFLAFAKAMAEDGKEEDLVVEAVASLDTPF